MSVLFQIILINLIVTSCSLPLAIQGTEIAEEVVEDVIKIERDAEVKQEASQPIIKPPPVVPAPTGATNAN